MMKYDNWDDFDPIDYVTRNFQPHIKAEDRIIIAHVIACLKEFSYRPIHRAADIGAGPNFYPAMLLSSQLGEHGSIDLLEPSTAGRAFMETLLGDGNGIYHNINKLDVLQSMDTREPWYKFEEHIATIGCGPAFQRTFKKARAASLSMGGDIYALPSESYDFVSAYFVAESITTDKDACERAVIKMLQAVRIGGGFMVAFMLGSNGWPAGVNTNFPAVNLSFSDIEQIFTRLPNFQWRATQATSDTDRLRDNYHGMAVVVGRRES